MEGLLMNTSIQTHAQEDRFESNRGFILPAANISASENGYLVELELPGVDRSGLEISIEGNELTVIGRRKTDVPQGELYYSETPQADFKRIFDVGPEIDGSKIDAKLEQGILKLMLPKAESAKPRKIEIGG
jgi:HSP20 family protein